MTIFFPDFNINSSLIYFPVRVFTHLAALFTHDGKVLRLDRTKGNLSITGLQKVNEG